MKPQDREVIRNLVRERLVTELADKKRGRADFVENTIQETLYLERQRLRDIRSHAETSAEARFYKDVQKRRLAQSQDDREAIAALVDHYTAEIVGNFSERVYRFSTAVIPFGLAFLLKAQTPKRLIHDFPHLDAIENQLIVQGELEHVRQLMKRGTLIFTPTHLSNLDSIIMGYSIFRAGMPPVIYGAGINLFENKLIGYFMHHLGAYKVDRRKKDWLYIRTLKEYATVSMELGYNNLFFPGGTRSRSGEVETKLKLGLLGCGLRAYINNLKAQKAEPRVFVIPVNINMALCLEAETLINDYLRITGGSRYIIVDDEFSRPGRIASYFKNLFNMDSKITVTFGRGLDPFGNRVDDEGRSLDPNGRILDVARYTWVRGVPEVDEERDQQFTRDLGEQVVGQLLAHNVILATNVAAFAVFQLMRREFPNLDLYRLIRLGAREFSRAQVIEMIARVMDELRRLERRGGILLGDNLAQADAAAILDRALHMFRTFHFSQAISEEDGRIFPQDTNLIFYYQNRLTHYGLEKQVAL